MNLNRIISHVRNSWRTLAICVVVGVLLGGVVALLSTPAYEAQATVLVSPNGPINPALNADAYFIQQRTQAYIDVVTSPGVLQPAAQQAGVDKLTVATVKVDWATTSPAVLKITVREPTARKAAAAANAVAERLGPVVEGLERSTSDGDARVRTSVASPAVEPNSPATPSLPFYLVLGVIVGLAVGLPLVLARLLLSRRVSDAPALREATDEPPLGVISAASSGGLILRDAPRSAAAEEFRKLRTSVQFAKPDTAHRSIVVTAPQLGAGATTVAANLALASVEAGLRVVLVDGDLRDGGLTKLLGLDGPGLAEVLSGAVELDAALHDDVVAGLTALGAGHPGNGAGGGDSGSLSGPGMTKLLEQLERRADLVIIDAPPALPLAAAAELAAIADAALLVARSGRTTVDELQQARATVSQVGTTILGIVINAVPAKRAGGAAGAGKPATRPGSGAAQPELADRPTS